MKKLLLPLFLTLFISFTNSSIYAQDVSTKGRDFWFGFMTNQSSGSTGLRTYISSSSLTPISGTISIPNTGWTQSFTVNPNSTIPIQFNETDVQPLPVEGKFNAVHITSCDSITVYAQNAHNNSNDATVIYPSAALKDKYMALNWDQTAFSTGYNKGDEILIVATENNTQIEIVPTVNTIGGHVANIPYTISLNQGETYQIINTGGINSVSLTGTTIEGVNSSECKPFAVYSGNYGTCISQSTSGDNLFAQLLPLALLGKDYVLVPLKQKSNTYYRIMATQNSTSVVINGGAPITLNKGQYHQFKNNISSYVTANNPIMIMQYAQSNAVDADGVGDPFQILMYPKEQAITNISFNAFTLNAGTHYWINVIAKTANVSSTTLDANNIASDFSVVPSNPFYSSARISVTQGNHILKNPDGLLCYVYGWGDVASPQKYESFGYCTGAALRDLTNNFTATPNPTCSGSTIDFTTISDGISSGYQWDFGDSNPGTSGLNTSHSFDSEGVFTVTLTKDRPGCNVVVKKNVTIIDPSIRINENDTTVCVGTQLQFSADADNDSIPNYSVNGCGDSTVIYQSAHFDSLSWSTGEYGPTINVTINSDTTIYVYGHQSGTNCLGVDSIHIHVINPNVTFTATPESGAPPLTVQFENTTLNSSNFIWDFGEGDTIHDDNILLTHIYDNIGDYTVILTGEGIEGCIDTAMVHIIVKYPPMQYAFPNIFTPNGDDQNDMFKLINPIAIKDLEIVILNRWGNVVFESDKVDFNWNGQVKNSGANCDDGTYFYKAKLKGLDDSEKEEHGFVQLTRNK